MPEASSPPVALITGAARRIGRAIAVDLAASGWTVAIHHRSSPDDAEALASGITGAGGQAAPFQADLGDVSACRSLVGSCIGRFGRVDCLVNNASVFEDDSLKTMTEETWQAHQAVNLRAPVFLAQAFADQPPETLTAGNIINIIDQRVWKLTPSSSPIPPPRRRCGAPP